MDLRRSIPWIMTRASLLCTEMKDGEEIILSQSVGADYWIDIDTQHGTLTEIDLSGVTVTLYEADGCMVALWQQDGYAFDLTIYGGLDREQVLRLVNSVRHP